VTGQRSAVSTAQSLPPACGPGRCINLINSIFDVWAPSRQSRPHCGPNSWPPAAIAAAFAATTRAAVGIIAELNHHHIHVSATADRPADDCIGISVLDCVQCDGTGTVRLDPGRGNRPTRSGR